MDITPLLQADKELLLRLNGSDSLFIDSLVSTLTAGVTWIPLYLALLVLVVKNNENARQIFLIILCAALCVILAGTIDDTLVKPSVARWRPAQDPEIGYLVDVVDGYRGGRFGFFSAHAANTFSIAVFFSLVIRNGFFSLSLIFWSLVNCWTRIYLGVHYPGDILAGLLWGGLMGFIVYRLFLWLNRSQNLRTNFVSSNYTSTGYLLADIDLVIVVLAFTFLFALFKASVLAI